MKVRDRRKTNQKTTKQKRTNAVVLRKTRKGRKSKFRKNGDYGIDSVTSI